MRVPDFERYRWKGEGILMEQKLAGGTSKRCAGKMAFVMRSDVSKELRGIRHILSLLHLLITETLFCILNLV